MSTILASPDFSAIKQKQQATWGSGDYSVVGTTLQIVGERLCEAIDVRSGERVLDVAAGNGNATLAAARHFAEVTSTDYVSELLERGEERAVAERLAVTFKVADAEALPFSDGEFDVALSTFGVMFTPDQEKAAGELSRVVRKGGRIGLANWTPESFIGQLFRVSGPARDSARRREAAVIVGDKSRLVELFPRHRIKTASRIFSFRYRSAAHWLDVFKNFYGPTHRAFASLEPTKAAALESEILELLGSSNRGGRDSLVVPSEYLEAVIVR